MATTTNNHAAFAALTSAADAAYTTFHKADKAGASVQELEALARQAARAHSAVLEAEDRPQGAEMEEWAKVARRFRRWAAEYRMASR